MAIRPQKNDGETNSQEPNRDARLTEEQANAMKKYTDMQNALAGTEAFARISELQRVMEKMNPVNSSPQTRALLERLEAAAPPPAVRNALDAFNAYQPSPAMKSAMDSINAWNDSPVMKQLFDKLAGATQTSAAASRLLSGMDGQRQWAEIPISVPRHEAPLQIPLVPPPAQVQEVMLSEATEQAADHRAGLADVMCDALLTRISEFQDTLQPDEELVAVLANFGAGWTIHIETITYQAPHVLVFDGSGPNGSKVRLLQHTAQSNILLAKAKVAPEEQRPARRVGFLLAKQVES